MKNIFKRAVCLLITALMMTAQCFAQQTENVEADPVDDNFRTFYQIFFRFK